MIRRRLPAYLAASPEDYARLRLRKGSVEPWEDGARTDGGKGTFEWWYFDSYLGDGSKLVIIFLPKNVDEMNKPIKPMITFHYDRADGTHFERIVRPSATAFSMEKDRCDVRMGRNAFQGDMDNYRIHLEFEGVNADFVLRRTSPPWRPETGHIFYGDQSEDFFAWVIPVPKGTVEADFTIEGTHYHQTGVGYHDHNWGNISMIEMLSSWYWARGRVGDYTAVSSFITSSKKYGYKQFPLLMLAREDRIVAEDPALITFDASDVHLDPKTRKPVANVTRYTHQRGDERYVVTFKRELTILAQRHIDQVKGIKNVLARLIGFDGGYHRFVGDIQLDHYDGDKLVETVHDHGLWEMNYLGKTRKEDLSFGSET